MNHQLADPARTPVTRDEILKICAGFVEIFIPAKMARKKKIAMGLVIVTKKTEKKSCVSLLRFILDKRN
jgi:hypothetical protein